MTPEQARTGMRVRVMEYHRVQERRGLLGTVVARYGGEDCVAVNVHLADGECRLFWPRDLGRSPPPPRRHGGASCSELCVQLSDLCRESLVTASHLRFGRSTSSTSIPCAFKWRASLRPRSCWYLLSRRTPRGQSP